jgi:hypothetical protein
MPCWRELRGQVPLEETGKDALIVDERRQLFWQRPCLPGICWCTLAPLGSGYRWRTGVVDGICEEIRNHYNGK